MKNKPKKSKKLNKANPEKNTIKPFFKLLLKAKLPYVWIIVYILVIVLYSNITINTTEYTANLFAGNISSKVIIGFILLVLVQGIFFTLSNVTRYLAEARINRNLRRMLWKKIVNTPYSFYNKAQPKELLTRITNDITSISSLIVLVIVPVLTTLYALIITLKRIGNYDSSLMLSIIAVAPITIAIGVVSGKLQFRTNDSVNKELSGLAQNVAEKTNHQMIIKSFGTQDSEEKSVDQSMLKLYKETIKNSWISSITNPAHAMATAMQIMLIALIGRGFYSSGKISLAQWIATFAFSRNIFNYIGNYANYFTTFKATQGATKRVALIMQENDEDLLTGENVNKLSGNINISNLSFSYGDKILFNNLNLTIPYKKKTAIVGNSGSGKTTLINIIDRLLDINNGEVLFGNDNISKYNKDSFRSNISYITQESTLLTGTIKENLLYGIKREVSIEELDEACRQANIIDYIYSLPNTYNYMINEVGANMSGGQRQKLNIARAFLRNNDYLFLDEATSAMDAISKNEVWNGLCKLMDDKTTVFIAHDRQTVFKADYIIVLENGEITDKGTLSELLLRNQFIMGLVNKKEELHNEA